MIGPGKGGWSKLAGRDAPYNGGELRLRKSSEDKVKRLEERNWKAETRRDQ